MDKAISLFVDFLDGIAANKRKWLLFFSLALLTRAFGAWIGGEGIHRGDDDGMHLTIAMHYLEGTGFWMVWQGLKFYCFQPPGMAVFHIIFLKLFKNYWLAERIFFVLMSSFTAVPFYKLSEKFFSPRLAVLLTLGFIFYPPQWFWSTRINAHAYCTNMLVITFYMLFHMWETPRAGRAFVIGLLWATMSLSRPEYMLGIFCMALGSAWKLRGSFAGLKIPTVLVIGWMVGLSPWIIRNYIRVGRLVPSSTHFSYNFWMVYNDEYSYGGHNFEPPPELDARLKAATEMERVDIWIQEGIKYIRADYGRAVKRTFLNFANFWRPWLSFTDIPLRDNLLYIVSWVPIFILFLIGLFKIPWKDPEWLVIWTFMLYKMTAQIPFYMIVRFREAIFPLFLLIAALPLKKLLDSSNTNRKTV